MINAFAAGTPKAVTEWVTTGDINGTGTSVVKSATLELIFPDASLVEPWVQVEFDAEVTASTGSGNGTLQTWVEEPAGGAMQSAANTVGAARYTSRAATGYELRRRRVAYPLLIAQHLSSSSSAKLLTDRVRIAVGAACAAADDEWAVTNIRARLVYTPVPG